MAKTNTVIIVGAGPVGAVLSYALRAKGIPVTMIEALASPEIDCRAASCHPPTVAMLDELGLLEDGLEQGLVSPVFHYIDRVTGDLVGRFDIGAMAEPPKHPYVLQWEQYKIVLTVLDRLKDDTGFDLRMSTRLTSIQQNDEGVVATVETAEGESVSIDGRFLVGCDGGRSTVRKLLDIEFEGFTWPERFIKIDTRYDFTNLSEAITNRNYFSDPNQWMNLFKARGEDGSGMWRSVSPTLPEQSEAELTSAEAVEARLQKFCPSDTPYDIVNVALYHVHQRVAATFNKGRVLLAGDAAHVNNPVGGMGMNGGIHDAINLADKIFHIWSDGVDYQPQFDLYTRQRRKGQIDYVQAQSIRNKETLGETDPAKRAEKLAAIRRQSESQAEHDAFIRRACMIDSLNDANATL
ncbi:FAD-dependent oxidoreductase [Teredinibacter turnerae]|uniref:FAD-dependent oxidoreductase n=1 Tax=Teredinibacter turnerae TaxID=2426 RepID=UPI00037B2CB8|nr:FAD-dependent monooxygenase [Teredinibacter turnerae]